MKFLRSTLGYMIAGVLAMGVWDAYATEYGILGGFMAALIIIAPVWYMNHYVGLIENENGHATVDMALGIGITGIARDVFMKGGDELLASVPTILLVVVGGVIGGLVAAAVEEDMEAKKAKETKEAKEVNIAQDAADEELEPGYEQN